MEEKKPTEAEKPTEEKKPTKEYTRGVEDLNDLRLYTLPELAPVLGLSRVAILGHIKRGNLRGRKIAGKWRITRAQLEDFINGARPGGRFPGDDEPGDE